MVLKRLGIVLSASVLWAAAHLPGTTATNPASGPTTKPTVKFSVATYNVNYGNANLKEIVKTIRKADAHLVCLQETNRQSEKYLRRAFRRKYRYKYFRSGQAAGGFGVLSKSPIKKVRYLPRKHGYFGTLLFHTKLGSKKVQVANIHLHPTVPRQGEKGFELLKLFLRTEAIRAREIKYIHANLTKSMPTILIGDFNSPPYMTVPVFLVKQGFTDSFAAVTRGADTHTTWRWRYRNTEWKYRLDYIFCNAHFKTLTSKIIKSDASDHYLVTSTLTWNPNPTTNPTSEPASQPSVIRH
jgi:endonuclease/exonuclease/phosphatase family metal-dependent hydrolase